MLSRRRGKQLLGHFACYSVDQVCQKLLVALPGFYVLTTLGLHSQALTLQTELQHCSEDENNIVFLCIILATADGLSIQLAAGNV